MVRRHRHRRRWSAGFLMHRAASRVEVLIAHPFRAGGIGVLSLALLWIVLTKSLPYALAAIEPDVALALNPSNPAALIAKAESLKQSLMGLANAATEKANAGEDKDSGQDTLAGLPQAKTGEGALDPSGERGKLRRGIRELALRAAANDPLNAPAFRLLAEVSEGAEETRMLMRQSLERSRHESIAAFWLLNDSVYRRDFAAAFKYADILLRTQPQLGTYVFAYLSLIAEDPEGRGPLISELASVPPWRKQFFAALPPSAKNMDTPLVLMTALEELGKPVSQAEIDPYLRLLIGKDRADLAYNAWLRFLPRPQLANVGLLTNANFESAPSGLPFDWQIGSGVNAIAEIVPLPGNSTKHALHVSLDNGRVQFPEVSQVILLGPGHYRLEGELKGEISGKRGLRWQIRCASGARRVLGETEMLLGQSQQWRIFSLEADVSQFEECRGQTLRLFHDSRSASEELLHGEVWFSNLHLERISSTAHGLSDAEN